METAYIAGLFDGEGSISIHRTTTGNYSTRYYLQVVIDMTDRETMDWVAEYCNTTWAYHSNPHYGNKDSYRVTRGNRDGISFLKEVFQFLITKKERAQLAIEFIENFDARKRTGASRLPDSVLAVRESYYQRMRELNKRGFKTV